MKKCCVCGNLALKSNLHKGKTENDGLKSNCKVCRKNYYKETLVKIKKCYLGNRDKIITQQSQYKNKNIKLMITSV